MPSVSCRCCFPSFLYRVYQPTLRRAEASSRACVALDGLKSRIWDPFLFPLPDQVASGIGAVVRADEFFLPGPQPAVIPSSSAS